MVKQEGKGAAGEGVNRGRRKRDEEMTGKSEGGNRKTSVPCPWAKQTGGDPLQQGNGLQSKITVDEKRSRDIENAADEAGPENRTPAAPGNRRRSAGCPAHLDCPDSNSLSTALHRSQTVG